MKQAMVVTHGGTDSKVEHCDGCQRAAVRALQKLDAGEDALEAAVAAVEVLEEDGRYGAGLGAPLGMDGKTLQMDAAVMDSRGRLGAVASIEQVVHPVRVARMVAHTPHCLLVGEGATEFARRIGLHQPFEPNAKVRKEFEEYVHKLQQAGDPKGPADDTEGDEGRALVKKFWNYRRPWQEVMDEFGHGTVGAVVHCDGRFAVAVSTGGSMPALRGRVADIPLVGCGHFAGARAALACSGIGEHNVRHLTASTVYRWIEAGMPLREALQRGAELTPPGLQSAMIGVTHDDAQLFARRPMAHAILRRP
ncbi:MAG: isoaspartyl peptidase/L-asparaginase [Pseudomonadota bacterium]